MICTYSIMGSRYTHSTGKGKYVLVTSRLHSFHYKCNTHAEESRYSEGVLFLNQVTERLAATGCTNIHGEHDKI